MISLRIGGSFIGRFFTQGFVYQPILVEVGLPPDAKFLGIRVDGGEALFDFEAIGEDRVIEAKLVNCELKRQLERNNA